MGLVSLVVATWLSALLGSVAFLVTTGLAIPSSSSLLLLLAARWSSLLVPVW